MDEKNAILRLDKKEIICRSNTPLWKIMQENRISISAHLAVRSGNLITEDEIIQPGDQIELIRVVSGG
jgi:sulfur carrier protein ThiS